MVPSIGDGGLGLVLLTTKYPLGDEAAAVKLPEIELDEIELNDGFVGWSIGATHKGCEIPPKIILGR